MAVTNETMSSENNVFQLPILIDGSGEKSYVLKTEDKYLDQDIGITVTIPAAATPTLNITDNNNDVTIGNVSSGRYPLTASLTGKMTFGTAGWMPTTGMSTTDSTVQVGKIIQSTLANGSTTINSGSTVNPTDSTQTINISAGYNSARTIKVGPVSAGPKGTITSGTSTISTVTAAYNSTNSNFDITGTGDISAPTVDTAGYVSSDANTSVGGTKNPNTGGASVQATLPKITVGTKVTSGTEGAVIPVIKRTAKASGSWIDAANGVEVTTPLNNLPYVQVDAQAIARSVTLQGIVTSTGYGTADTDSADGQYTKATAKTITTGSATAETKYVPIKTATPTFTGGTITGSATASSDQATLATTNTSGIVITANATANREAVTYSAVVSGWVSQSSGAIAYAASSSETSLTASTYYLNSVTVPASKTFTVTTIGTTKVTSNSNSTGTITVNAYPASGSTRDGEKTIVSAGKWQCVNSSGTAVSSLAAGTYYGKVVIGAVNGSIGGSPSSGSATAVITNTNSITTITDITGKTAGTDYWQIKATATGSAGSYTPKYTVNTAGWIASTVNGTAQTVSVTSDSTGKSIYIPKATFTTVNGNQIKVSSAGYIPKDAIAGTITPGSISTSETDPGTGYTENITAAVPAEGYLVIPAGYYNATKITLGTLIGDNASIIPASEGGTPWVHPNYKAYDDQGRLLQGTMTIYSGAYTLTT